MGDRVTAELNVGAKVLLDCVFCDCLAANWGGMGILLHNDIPQRITKRMILIRKLKRSSRIRRPRKLSQQLASSPSVKLGRNNIPRAHSASPISPPTPHPPSDQAPPAPPQSEPRRPSRRRRQKRLRCLPLRVIKRYGRWVGKCTI